MKHFARHTLLFALFVICSAHSFAQDFRIESKPSSSAPAGAETFTSLESRFSIALPKQISGFNGSPIETPQGRVERITYDWRTAQGVFMITYFQRPEILSVDGKRVLDAMRDGMLTATKNLGSALATETDITLDGHRGREIKINLSDGTAIEGNEMERIIYEPRDNSIREKYSYAYEFDAKGNWTKQTASKWTTKDGSSSFEPYSVTYRTITYY